MEIQHKADEFLTIEELAIRWKVAAHWLYGNHKAKQIPTLKIGRSLRFPRKEIEEWEAIHTKR
jgi:excisionase family DNA binding protein